jgi:hypothetical protein
MEGFLTLYACGLRVCGPLNMRIQGVERQLSVVEQRISWNGARIKPLKRFQLIL